MSETMNLLSVLLVLDDETGAGDSGDFDYSIPMNGWMDRRRENRPALAKFLRELAADIENGEVGYIPKPEPIPETPEDRARIEAAAERAFGPIRRAMDDKGPWEALGEVECPEAYAAPPPPAVEHREP